MEGVLAAICDQKYMNARQLINGLPSEQLKRRSLMLIEKIVELNQLLEGIKTSKEAIVNIALELSEKVKNKEHEANSLKRQLEQNNKQTVVKSQSSKSRDQESENEEAKRQIELLRKENVDLVKQNKELKIENKKLLDQCRIKERKLIVFKEQVCKLMHQNKQLKHKSQFGHRECNKGLNLKYLFPSPIGLSPIGKFKRGGKNNKTMATFNQLMRAWTWIKM